jgi:hypothetical protein
MDESSQEKSSDIEFEPVAPVQIPENILSNDRDYLYECISIINRCTQKTAAVSHSHPDKSTFTKHFVLYAFIALSLVIEAERDVCAVAIYLYHNRTEVSRSWHASQLNGVRWSGDSSRYLISCRTTGTSWAIYTF